MCVFTNCSGAESEGKMDSAWHSAKNEILGCVVLLDCSVAGFSYLVVKAASDAPFDAAGGIAFLGAVLGGVFGAGLGVKAYQRIRAAKRDLGASSAPHL